MSAPFLIWAMRRTGGTTLAAFLASLSEHPKVPHEPFNPERKFGAVTTAWRKGQDRERLRAGIEAALAPRPVIKHCYEIMPPELNATLMQVASEKGYRHVILDRRAETDRILSLELAKITGAWGSEDAKRIYARIKAGEAAVAPVDIPGAVAHLRYCHKRRQEIRDLLSGAGQAPHVIYFEDVYSDPEAGRARVGALVDFLGMDPADHPRYAADLSEALLTRGQNSARIMSAVPNIDEARAALDAEQDGLSEVFAAS